MSKKFTIVFPTRERIELLNALLLSIESKTKNLNDIEVLIAVDNDDQGTLLFLANKWAHHPWVVPYAVQRSLNFSRDYYSYLARAGTGKWIIACNDDAEFQTQDWDVAAAATLSEYIGDGPNVVMGWIEDRLGEDFRAKGHGKYCCFPLIGRDGFNALDAVFPERIPTWGADIWIRKLYDNIKRVVEVPIVISHNCYHNKTRAEDHINKHVQENQVGYDVTPAYSEINPLLKMLRNQCVRT